MDGPCCLVQEHGRNEAQVWLPQKRSHTFATQVQPLWLPHPNHPHDHLQVTRALPRMKLWEAFHCWWATQGSLSEPD